MILIGALPAAALFLTWISLVEARGPRAAWLDAGVIGGVLVAVSTEGLSLAGQLSFWPLLLFWTASTAVASVAAVRWRPRPWAITADRHAALAMAPFALVMSATLVVAIVAPPNTWDSMTYHMARVAHWVAQGSVANYPTETLRQLYQPPWAEFAITHLQILTGGDHLANLVQWSCAGSSLIAVWLIAEELGAPPLGQFLSAALAGTLPIGILQASSTQNDFVEAFWLGCAAWYALSLRRRFSAWSVAGLAASLGLAVLTKGTAYIYALPIVAFAGWWLLSQQRWNAWKSAGAIVLVVLVLNVGAWARNVDAFGGVLGPPQPYTNQLYTPQALVSNLVRDASVQVGTPWTSVNYQLARAVSRVHRILGIDLNDPRTTWPGTGFQVNLLRQDEDSSPNPLQFLLLLVAAVACLLRWRRFRPQAVYLGAVAGAFLVFALLLRYQPWHSRLELPLMVLAAPFTGTVLSTIWPGRITTALAMLCFIASIPWLLGPSIRPLVGPQSILTASRSDVYFYARPELEASYLHAADEAHISGCRVVGIDGSENSWEYPLWVYLGAGYRVVPVHPAPGTARLGGAEPPPCLTLKAP